MSIPTEDKSNKCYFCKQIITDRRFHVDCLLNVIEYNYRSITFPTFKQTIKQIRYALSFLLVPILFVAIILSMLTIPYTSYFTYTGQYGESFHFKKNNEYTYEIQSLVINTSLTPFHCFFCSENSYNLYNAVNISKFSFNYEKTEIVPYIITINDHGIESKQIYRGQSYNQSDSFIRYYPEFLIRFTYYLFSLDVYKFEILYQSYSYDELLGYNFNIWGLNPLFPIFRPSFPNSSMVDNFVTKSNSNTSNFISFSGSSRPHYIRSNEFLHSFQDFNYTFNKTDLSVSDYIIRNWKTGIVDEFSITYTDKFNSTLFGIHYKLRL